MPAAMRLECMEIWGGNQAADSAIAVSGMDAWVLSEPYGGEAAGGGDIHFVSTCGHGLVLLYSDAAIEARNSRGEQLGEDGLLERLHHLDPNQPERFHYAVFEELSTYRNHEPADDDLTFVLLHHNAGKPPRQSIRQMVKVMGKMTGLVKV